MIAAIGSIALAVVFSLIWLKVRPRVVISPRESPVALMGGSAIALTIASLVMAVFYVQGTRPSIGLELPRILLPVMFCYALIRRSVYPTPPPESSAKNRSTRARS